MRDRLYHILLSFATALTMVAGCARSGLDPIDDGQGTVVLNIGPATTRGITAADSDNDQSPDDGDKMTSLSVWLVRDGKVARFKKMPVDVKETAVCDLGTCARGDYKLYVVANYKKLDEDYSEEGKSLDADFTDKVLGAIEAGNSPAYSSAGALAKVMERSDTLFTDGKGGMPLSYVGDVSVGPGANVVSVELQRVCARFTITVFNNAVGKKVCVNKVTLSGFNPTVGYLFPHFKSTWENEVPSAAAGFAEVAFPDVGGARYAVIEAGESMVISDLYLYETDGSVDKTFNIRGALYDGSATPVLEDGTVTTYSLENNTTSVTSGRKYLIRSASSSTYYLGTEGTDVRLWSYTSDGEIMRSPDIGDFIWTITGDSDNGYKFYNEKFNRYLTISESSAGVSETAADLSYSLGSISNGSYYLTNSSNKPAVVTSGSNAWYIRPVKETSTSARVFGGEKLKDIHYESSIVHVDKYGEPFDLAQLRRNEHLQLNLAVTYSDATGNFEFRLVEWGSKKSETTFD